MRFPDGRLLQARFAVREPVQAVYDLVQASIDPNGGYVWHGVPWREPGHLPRADVGRPTSPVLQPQTPHRNEFTLSTGQAVLDRGSQESLGVAQLVPAALLHAAAPAGRGLPPPRLSETLLALEEPL